MANLTLKQLREAQASTPSLVNDDGVREPFVVPVLYQRPRVEFVDGLERLVATPEGVLPNPEWESAPGRFPGLERDAFKPLNIGPPPGAAGPTPAASLPLQASAPVPAVPGGGFVGLDPGVGSGLKGFTRIFPATFPSIGAIPQVWKDENWTSPSPWCHVEGAERHPDFESNLLLVEAQDVKVEEKSLTFAN